jgi:hypothetical protein
MRPLLPGGALALDLSSTTGWCYGLIGALAPEGFGVWRLPYDGGEGGRYAAFENAMIEGMHLWSPSRVILEAPFTFQALLGVSTERVMKQQYTLRGIAYAEAWRAGVPIEEVSSDLVRLEVLGQSRFAKDTVKREVIKYCRGRGWNVPDHNAGDACVIWVWLNARLSGRAPVSGPLFREGRAA